MSNAYLAIDTHVHLHEAETAISALQAAQHKLASAPDHVGVVMLAERQGFDILDQIRPGLCETGERESLWLTEERRLLVLAGRQVISSEKLEILALATAEKFPDGLPAAEIIAGMTAAGAIVVLPWGVGKWLGKRGALIDQLIANAEPGRLFLGDNHGRPAFWRVPQFGKGLPVLSGSDPLPLPGWQDAIGRFGSSIEGSLSPASPAASLKALLRDPATHIHRLGRLSSPMRFILDQTRLRLSGAGACR